MTGRHPERRPQTLLDAAACAWSARRAALGVALVHTALALPFAALITSSLFMGIPRELEEAAWVFGCSRFEAFRRVVLPLALPGIAATPGNVREAARVFVVEGVEAVAQRARRRWRNG